MNEKDEPPVGLKRRDFLLLGAAAAACAGCRGMGGAGPERYTGTEQTIDAGPVSKYAADGVYSNFRALGFFIIRRGDKLEAISSVCTHRHCKVNADGGNGFYCHCHGSGYDSDGRVTNGPATQNLAVLQTVTDASGHLLVRTSA